MFLWEKEIYDYTVEIENYDPDNDILEYTLIDNSTGEKTHVNTEESSDCLEPQVAISSVALVTLIYDILTVAVVLIVVAGISYYAYTKVEAKVKSQAKKNKNYFYYAMLSNGNVLIGNAFKSATDAKAYAKINYNSGTLGVFCVGSSTSNNKINANAIAAAASPVYRAVFDKAHSNSCGYFDHYHPASKNGRYHEHIWFS